MVLVHGSFALSMDVQMALLSSACLRGPFFHGCLSVNQPFLDDGGGSQATEANSRLVNGFPCAPQCSLLQNSPMLPLPSCHSLPGEPHPHRPVALFSCRTVGTD